MADDKDNMTMITLRTPQPLLTRIGKVIAAVNVKRADKGEPPLTRSAAFRQAIETWCKQREPKPKPKK
jgi:hypothetical protein